MKTCISCQQKLDESEFYLDRGVLKSKCKECFKKYRRNYYKENRGKTLASVKKYQQSEKGSEKIKIYAKKRAQTPEFKAYAKKWQLTEKGKENRRRRVNRFAQTEKGFTANKKRHAKRRANKESIINDFTFQEWQEILNQFNYCFYCGSKFTGTLPPTQDHFIPISKGGDHTKNNIVPACKPCNSRKGDRLWDSL